MARIKLAYIGGGSTRAPGTMASFIERGDAFAGSEIVLIDLDSERLAIVRAIAERMARARNLDLRVTATTDRRAGLAGCDAVLTSFRPGGFEARYLDESIPLKYGVIGQETQGPGGFFMALRAITAMRSVVADIEAICPDAWLFNYTNPINLVSQAITRHSPIKAVSLCEGPIIFPRALARYAGLDPDKLDTVMIGLNHGSWTIRHLYDGQDVIPLVQEAYGRLREDPATSKHALRMLRLAATMGSIGAEYFQYYYFKDELLAELQAKPTTRAQDIMARTGDMWAHYRALATSDEPTLDPTRSRGGPHELELAIDAIDALFNDRRIVLPVNVPNRGAISGFPDDLVVEVPGYVDRNGVLALTCGALPPHLTGLVEQLGHYQSLAADAAWQGTRRDALYALLSHPLVFSLPTAEALYDELAAAHRAYLPERLLR